MSEEKKKVGVYYGALVDPIEEQLNKQGFTLGGSAEKMQEIQKALTLLRFHLLTDSQYNACVSKLHKLVMKRVEPLPEGGKEK